MLKNLVGFISGGASGLGKATAEKLVTEGCKIAIYDLPTSKGQEVADSLGENAFFSPGDVLSETQLAQAYNTVEERYGRLDFIVSCAGRAGAHSIYHATIDKPFVMETFQDVLNTNTCGTFNVVRLGVHLLTKNKINADGQAGAVITTSGFEAFDGQTGQCSVAAASGAIAAMTLPMARDLGKFGIRVVNIAPGLMESYITGGMPDKLKRHLTLACPTPKRLGKAEEFAHAVKFILENPYINGEVIRLDGGLRIYLY